MNRSTAQAHRPPRIPIRMPRPAQRPRKPGAPARQISHRTAHVREAERMRIARDLHDELGYRLMALILEIDRVTCRYQGTGRLADDMARIRSYLVQTATAIHDIAVNLSSQDLAGQGLPAALANLARQSEAASSMRILVSASGELESLPPEVALVAYRITQEALTNALKYADASTITISASLAHGRLTLTITDDGIGCGAPEPGTAGRPVLGIRGMRERAAAIGGRLELTSRLGQGTTVRATLPVEA